MKTTLVVAVLSFVLALTSVYAEINSQRQLATTGSPLDAFLAAVDKIEKRESRRHLRSDDEGK
ncbi:hypothetical protein PR003_g15358 [Phytophthora rubi]|uniref:RxLR effector protein n=1 Tax=Phytophthora rubi TaxID=129364 RepID=A0A6A3LAY8_9STRA|nr:hypothetical protein PR001_g14612 [Phytophthora rubi]KAE9330228.1 hypothetical protein PR003_g15358 [Phytophthora rubi]